MSMRSCPSPSTHGYFAELGQHAELVAHDPLFRDLPVLHAELHDGGPFQVLLLREPDVAGAAAENVRARSGAVMDAYRNHVALRDQAGQLGGKRGVVLQHRAQSLHRRVEADDVEAGTVKHDLGRHELGQALDAAPVQHLTEIALDDRLVAGFLRLGHVDRLRHAVRRPQAAPRALSATFAANRAWSMTNRSWVPSLIFSAPSWADTVNDSLRPSTRSSRTSTVTVRPGGVAARCDTSMRVPSDCSRGQSRWGRSASMHAHSSSPTR